MLRGSGDIHDCDTFVFKADIHEVTAITFKRFQQLAVNRVDLDSGDALRSGDADTVGGTLDRNITGNNILNTDLTSLPVIDYHIVNGEMIIKHALIYPSQTDR